jgi:hypothetical protein
MSDIKIERFLDLSKIFKKLEDKSYCIIKIPNVFPSYDIGSDLDIFCYNVQDIAKIILSNIQELITTDLKIGITDNNTQIYIDIIKNDKIHFRFDLYGTLPYYKNVNIKEAFFSSVIENSQIIKFDNTNISVPSNIDEAILRYIEYQEWYAQRPDKIKHIKYLEDKIETQEIDINKMFDKLHYYITIPDVSEDRIVSSIDSIRYVQYLYGNIKKVIKYIQVNGMKKTFDKIKSKIIK